MFLFILILPYIVTSQKEFYECRQLTSTSLVDVSPINFINTSFSPTTIDESNQTIYGAYQYETIYTLNAFSLTTISIDLRHLYQFPNTAGEAQFNYTQDDWNFNIYVNQSSIELTNIFEQDDVEKNTSFYLNLFVYETLTFQITIGISSEEYYSQKYQFMNTTKVFNLQPQTAIAQTNSIFAFVLTSGDSIALPANALPLDDTYNYLNYIATYYSDNYFQSNSYTIYSPQSRYWGDRSNVIVPYFPYFSNCQGFGQYIYFYQLIQHANCTLYSEEDTEAINPFQFGMNPKSDICEDLTFLCILDEKYNNNPRLPRWFELQTQDTIFNIVQDPIDPNSFSDEDEISSNNIVSIQTVNQIPTGMMPLEVNVVIYYYQVTQAQKRIIVGTVEFTNFQTLTEDQKAKKTEIEYNLIFNFIPMTQGQLVNNFALEWPVYFILYMIIGALIMSEVGIFFIYFYIFNRKERPQIKMFVYVKTFWIWSFGGTVLAFFPGLAIYILIAIIMTGKFWTTDLSLSCDLTPYSESDDGCAVVFFDLFKNNLKYTDDAFTLLRNARSGVAMITVGIYLVTLISGIYIPKNSEPEDYNGNSKNDRLWKRGRILYALGFITSLMLVLIQFSFTNVFANNAYYFLVFNKVTQMIIEYILEVYFDNNLIASPIGVICATHVNIATMGNPTFYDFLLSTFIDKGVEMCERAYIIKIQDFVVDNLEEQYEKAHEMVMKLLNEEEEEIDIEDDKFVDTTKLKDEDDSDSEIVFSDDEKEDLASDDESVWSNKVSNNIDDSMIKIEHDEFEEKFRQILLDLQYREYQLLDDQKQEQDSKEEAKEKEEDEEEDETDIIDYFSNFANDIITLVFNPFVTTAMWIFYDESSLLADYQINKSEYIYYFLWTIILIPFQIVVDVFGYNLVEQFHELDFLSYIQNAQKRFKNRRNLWKADDEDKFLKCETCFTVLDQWCYSTQYYFITTLQVTAIQLIIFGSHIIYTNQYMIFSDEALIFIVIIWLIISRILHEIFLFIGKKLKIWDISSRVTPSDLEPQAITLMEEIIEEDSQSNVVQEHINNWKLAVEFREQTERLQDTNNTFLEFESEQFKKSFVQVNIQWLQDNIKQVLSPKTLNNNRKLIFEKFNKIYGPLEIKNEEDPVAGFDNAWNYRQFTKKQQGNEMGNNQAQKFNRRIDNLPLATQAILRYWLYRSRNMKIAIKYIGGLLEKITKPFCEYCGLNWGLGVDTETRIEDIYLRFLKLRKLKQVTINMGSEIDYWQNYFPKQCKFKTTCFICNVFMIEEMQKNNNFVLLQNKKQIVQKKKNKYTFKKVARLIQIMIIFIQKAQKYKND